MLSSRSLARENEQVLFRSQRNVIPNENPEGGGTVGGVTEAGRLGSHGLY